MKRRSIVKTIPSISIFFSGYAPLFLIMAIKDVSGFVWYEKQFTESVFGMERLVFPYFLTVNNPGVVIGLLAISILTVLMLWYVVKNIADNVFPIEIVSAKSRSSEVVNYTIPYMISFVAFDLSKWQDLVSLVVFLSLLCLLSIRSQSIFINPILAAAGYGLYDCQYAEHGTVKDCVMLSKEDIKEKQGVSFKKLTNYMGIIATKKV